jgi:hypothetical protein
MNKKVKNIITLSVLIIMWLPVVVPFTIVSIIGLGYAAYLFYKEGMNFSNSVHAGIIRLTQEISRIKDVFKITTIITSALMATLMILNLVVWGLLIS